MIKISVQVATFLNHLAIQCLWDTLENVAVRNGGGFGVYQKDAKKYPFTYELEFREPEDRRDVLFFGNRVESTINRMRGEGNFNSWTFVQ